MNHKILAFTISLFITSSIQANWVDNWVDQSSSSGPSYFEGQKRGYISGGTFSARWKHSTEYPLSLTAPRIKSGCGGVDLFMGGFSFLDPEYLMQKLQRALQAAPAVAFDLALKEACPECANTIKDFEKIINELNSFQINECTAARALVDKTPAVAQIGAAVNTVAGVIGQGTGAVKGWINLNEEVEDNKGKVPPTIDMKQSIQNCPAEFKEIVGTPGSILQHVADRKGLGDYTDQMRSYVGDIEVRFIDNTWSAHKVPACADTNAFKVDDILTGNSVTKPLTRPFPTNCSPSNDKGLLLHVGELMDSIAGKIKNNANYTSAEIAFLNISGIPVYNALKAAAANGTIDIVVQSLREPIATAMAYAVLNDLMTAILDISRLADDVADPTGVVGPANDSLVCDTAALLPVKRQISTLRDNAQTLLNIASKSRADAMARYSHVSHFIDNMLKHSQKSNNLKFDR